MTSHLLRKLCAMCQYKKGKLLPLTTGGRAPHTSHTVFYFIELLPSLMPSVFTYQRQPPRQQRSNTSQGPQKELTELSPTPKNNPVWKPSIYLILGKHKRKNKYRIGWRKCFSPTELLFKQFPVICPDYVSLEYTTAIITELNLFFLLCKAKTIQWKNH